MRELAPVQGAQPAQSTARSIAQILQRTHDTMLAPQRLSQAIFEAHPTWYKAIYGPQPQLDDLRHPIRSVRAYALADEIFEQLPSEAELREVIGAMDGLANAKADPQQIRLLISLMIDGFPNARPHNPVAYLELLVHHVNVAGYSTPTVAQACDQIAQTAKFPPSVSEFLEVCAKAAELVLGRERFAKALELRTSIAAMIAEAERLGPRDVDEEWRVLIRAYVADGSWPKGIGGAPDEPWTLVPDKILAEFDFARAENTNPDGSRTIAF